MGFFSKPKCPHCGGQLTETGYSFPFPEWRCSNCIEVNGEKKKMQKRIDDLEARLKNLEGKKD